MLRTGHLYHFITAAVFVGLGIYLYVYPQAILKTGLDPFWVSVLLILWGGFRAINGILLYRKQQREESDTNA